MPQSLNASNTIEPPPDAAPIPKGRFSIGVAGVG